MDSAVIQPEQKDTHGHTVPSHFDTVLVCGKHQGVTDTYIFSVFCIEVLIIRYDKMVSHMMSNMCICICHKGM
jgi:hypothetical protein